MLSKNEIYLYDGSFEGMLTCVFICFHENSLPLEIVSEDNFENSFLPVMYIETDKVKADRVYSSLSSKISKSVERFVKEIFLTCLDNKEIHLIKFLKLAYKTGPSVMNMHGNETVSILQKAVKSLYNEKHNYCGFIRFTEYEHGLVSVIQPKNFILPILANHFSARYNAEDFLIYDKTHQAGLVHRNYKSEIIKIDSLTLPDYNSEEQMYQELWKQFYNTIAIEGRYNPKCRQTHMPKRYWSNMTEFN